MNYNWAKHYAIKQRYEKEFDWVPKKPGIYLWTRFDSEINKTYYYIGQAQNLFNRRFDYYKIQTGLAYPTRHFEASLKKHKDWKFQIIQECELGQLDQLEKMFIQEYMTKDNYITRNDSLTGNDTTKSNYHRIEKIQKKFDKDIQKCLKNLEVITAPDGMIIKVLKNKDGSYTKRSMDSFKTFLERIGIDNEKNKNE